MPLLLLLLPTFVFNHVEAAKVFAPWVGVIIIEGNKYTEDRVILNELRSAGLEVGKQLTEAKLRMAAENINRRGIFDADEPAQVFVLESVSSAKHIVVRVKETRTGTFRSGPGVCEYRPAKPIPDAYRKLTNYWNIYEIGSYAPACATIFGD